ncbi:MULTISPECIES: carboxymuconolactone decarboxylase family protein [unclassified Caballeronia]|uniref:carboxymuconolactone decarboxylase family protein n=1 Tax=unclassified Caballeronia TaxID=2646786 RepID=UPI00285F4134|nr:MULTISPECIES: carboxymuconolactone decarboxylase family protein [unclassified Caballeronia]MDR5753675.1 carboxymuconolactone decarboxylase family protein [Caballeronia sp. LZ024]MDR5840054.1 carboxymuconolactone decarboxylase family protein [Caballeronia sp. LZ031]
MSRLSQINVNEATGAAADLFANIKRAAGRVPNAYATVGTHNPAVLAAALNGDAVLAKSSLDKRDLEAIKLAVSEIAGCDYCVAAHTAIGKMVGLSLEETKQVRAGIPTGNAERDALVRFVRHVVSSSGTVERSHLDDVRAAGYSEAQVVDALFAISVIGFTNLLNRVNDTDLDFPAVQ